jgi:hypothetical protein
MATTQGMLVELLDHVWSTTHRNPTVASGTSFAQVPGTILGKPARVQNPDQDEVPGSRPVAGPQLPIDLAMAAIRRTIALLLVRWRPDGGPGNVLVCYRTGTRL